MRASHPRRPSVRWAVPAAAAVVVAAVAAVPQLAGTSAASTRLAPMTPTQLLAAVRVAASSSHPLSGTIAESTSLGLPDLGLAGGGTSPQTLLTGSHTLRVWVGGATQQRVALLGPSAEYDVVHSGSDLWTYESDSMQVGHATVPAAGMRESAQPDAGGAELAATTPTQLAQRLLAAVDPTTTVTVADQVTVAGRPARELVLTPKTSDTLVGSVRIAVDATTSLPLQVRIYPRSGGAPALSVGFTHLSIGAPAPSVFAFSPPRGATVTQLTPPAADSSHRAAPKNTTATLGSGWSSVLSVRLPAGDSAGSLRTRLEQLSSPDPAGRVITTRLVTVLLTPDGRVLLGAVPATVLDRDASLHP